MNKFSHRANRFSISNFFQALFLVAILGSAQLAFAQISITPVSWNVIGLDSNNTAVGPDTFPIGARVCNTTGTAINNVVVTFVWDSSNIYINLEGGDTINVGTLPAGACRDYYFIAKATRSSSAYNATRRYHITASGQGAATVSTPTPRELYVEKLVSQNRNSVVSMSGPSTVYVGNIYTFTLNADTATNGYEQLEAFLPFSASIFEVTAINTTYTAPSGGTNDKFYADACGWNNDPTIPATYRSCTGSGKAGGKITTTYTVRVIGTGSASLSALVYDFSGSSYHYNSDFGNQVLAVTALNPPDMTIAKSHTGNFTQGQTGATYQITASNTGGAPSTGTVTVTDTLPTGLTPTGATGTGWTCNIASQTMTCTRSDALAASAAYPVITLTVNVSTTAPASITNQATVAGGGETNTTNNTASDPTTIDSVPHLALTKTCGSPTNCDGAIRDAGTDLTYNIVFTNDGGTAAQRLVLIDPIPADTDFKVGSVTTNAGTTGLTFTVEYSSDYSAASPSSATWTYTPASGAGGASSGYDRTAKAIRWRVTAGNLSPTAPNNTGNVSFIVRIK